MMTQPESSDTQASGRERIATAFWNFIETSPMTKLTVSRLCKDAKVNHNTFYYHFASADDMARTLIMENSLLSEVRDILRAGDNAEVIARYMANSPDGELHIRRFSSLVRNGSPQMVAELREGLIQLWLEAIEVNPSELSTRDTIMLEFIAGGNITAIATAEENLEFPEMLEIYIGEFGKYVREELTEIAKRYHG